MNRHIQDSKQTKMLRLQKNKVVLSISNALFKWLKLELSRFPVAPGKQPGVQPLVTDDEAISWQCLIFTDSWRERATVIAVEAHSRFTLLLPFGLKLIQAQQLEHRLCEEWAEELVQLMIKNGEVSREQAPRIFTSFHERIQEIGWVKNTGLSVNGHVNDVEQWVKETLADRGAFYA